ncbi:trypsin-like peptidase domain-containing protein [Pseudoalteromonas luteoviolacea]|uniref:trypsin-like peptidase domain-containing protein n=1 Tax=Pseudoalteromonas luteoviolacea TaxID=43657 RepID=UPI0031BB77B5|nr:trypsin-like peptidase domain-containing protein [Pseudoalteromonas luteoviolacea]
MLQFIRFILAPVMIGLGIAFLILWLKPELKERAANLNVPYTLEQMSFANGVSRAAPAVVTIFSESFSSVPRFKRQNRIQELGSGVIMSADGYLLTNYHVINSADQIIVLLPDGRQYYGILIGFDTITDLAVIKVEDNHLPVIPMDDNLLPRIGDVVLAIGNPLNLGQTITQGIISATGKQALTESQYNSLLQTDAAVNVGNSGGALVNSNGTLVGITSAQFTSRYNIDIEGISFAVPYRLAKDVMTKIIEDGRVIRGYLGFKGTAVDNKGQIITDVYTPIMGLRINDLDPLGPAWQVGMKDGDIVTKVAGKAITNPQQTLRTIGNTEPGTVLEFEVNRKGKRLSFMVEVVELETPIY